MTEVVGLADADVACTCPSGSWEARAVVVTLAVDVDLEVVLDVPEVVDVLTSPLPGAISTELVLLEVAESTPTATTFDDVDV